MTSCKRQWEQRYIVPDTVRMPAVQQDKLRKACEDEAPPSTQPEPVGHVE